MSNPFSLKKEVPKSYFKGATMIIHKDMGKGKSKKFLFDYNACEALKIDETTCIAFIVNPPNLFLADISHVDKDKWGIGEQEFNLFNKNVEYRHIEGNKYKFKTFSNSALFNVLIEEYELNRELFNIYLLSLIPKEDFPLFLDEESCKMMERMEIDTLYHMDLFNSISSLDDNTYSHTKNRKGTLVDTLEEYLSQSSDKKWKSSYDQYVTVSEAKLPKFKKPLIPKEAVTLTSLDLDDDTNEEENPVKF